MRLVATLRNLLLATAALGAAPALDTSLVLTQQELGVRIVTIDPPAGAMRLYEIGSGKGLQALRQMHTHNFQADMRRLLGTRTPLDNPARIDPKDPAEVFWPLARFGTTTTSPSYLAMLKMFPKGEPLLQIYRTEDDFFKPELAYDGKARAAFARSTLLVVVPSTYTILSYGMESDEFRLQSVRNYRLELYAPTSDGTEFSSAPAFNELKTEISRLRGGDTLLAERLKELDDSLTKQEKDGKEKLLPVAPSDPWISALDNNRYIMVDQANSRLMLYEAGNRNMLFLRSLRNFDLDRRLPSFPLPNARLDEYDRGMAEFTAKRMTAARRDTYLKTTLADLQTWITQRSRSPEGPAFTHFKPDATDLTVAFFRALADVKPAGAKEGGDARSSAFEANVVGGNNNERLYLDLRSQRRLLAYELAGDNDRLELISSRDYTIDTGVAMYEVVVREQIDAAEMLTTIERNSGSRGREAWLMATVKNCLALDPNLHEKIASNRRLADTLQSQAEFKPTLELAVNESKAREDRRKAFQERIKADLLARDTALREAKKAQR